MPGVKNVRRPSFRPLSTSNRAPTLRSETGGFRFWNRQRIANSPLVLFREQLLPHPLKSFLVVVSPSVSCHPAARLLLEEAANGRQRAVVLGGS